MYDELVLIDQSQFGQGLSEPYSTDKQSVARFLLQLLNVLFKVAANEPFRLRSRP